MPDAVFEPITHTSVNEAVYRALRDRLMHGDFRAGDVLGIQDLANSLCVSTMPVREALRRLSAQGALEVTKSRSLRVPLVTRERLDDIRRVRALTEGAATEWAVPRMRPETVRQLRSIADELAVLLRQPPTAISQSLQRNQIFHFTIYEAAGSPVIYSTIETLWLRSGPYLRTTRERMHSDERPADELHDAIVSAIERGDARGAREAIERDVTWAFDHALETASAVPSSAT